MSKLKFHKTLFSMKTVTFVNDENWKLLKVTMKTDISDENVNLPVIARIP